MPPSESPPDHDREDVAATSPAGIWCIVVAGGSGARYGGLKQFENLAGRRIIDRSVDLAERACDGVVVVLPAEFCAAEADRFNPGIQVVAGGATRAESVRAGLAAVPGSAEYVLVHDGARPLATQSLFQRVIEALLSGAVAVIPALDVADTLRRIDGGVVDREAVRAVQTPQGFSAEVLRAAHSEMGEATDDAGLVEQLGWDVTLVDGERLNLKITEPVDMMLAEAIVRFSTTRDEDSSGSVVAAESAGSSGKPGRSQPVTHS